LLGGHVDYVIKTAPSSMPQITSGDAKALLVTRATPVLPGVPTGAQKGLPNFNINLWYGLFVHPGIPKPVYNILVSAVEATVKKSEVRKKLESIGLSVEYIDPGGCSTLVEEQWRTIALMIKEFGLKVN